MVPLEADRLSTSEVEKRSSAMGQECLDTWVMLLDRGALRAPDEAGEVLER
jgi:hypothetical protein